MGGRSAVYIMKDGNSSFWGLVTVTIDFDNLIKVIDMDNLNGMGVDYNLSYIDSDGKAHVMYGVGELGKDTVKTQFNVRNLIWELEVIPKQGWVTTEEIVISVLFILMLSCFVGLLTYMMLQLRENNVMLQQMSTTDAMTGCQNRRAYEDKMLELSTGKIGKDFVYISADINGLKVVNDTLGHAAGDELISGATSCLQKGFSPYGSLYGMSHPMITRKYATSLHMAPLIIQGSFRTGFSPLILKRRCLLSFISTEQMPTEKIRRTAALSSTWDHETFTKCLRMSTRTFITPNTEQA